MTTDSKSRRAEGRPGVLIVSQWPLAVIGGIEIVTARLIEGLAGRGWPVCFLVARKDQCDTVRVENEEGDAVDLPSFMETRKIAVVINQIMFTSGFARWVTGLGLGVRLITVFHTRPAGGITTFQGKLWRRAARERGWRVLGDPRLAFYPLIFWLRMRNKSSNSRCLRENHDLADRFVLLSERYFPEFQQMSGVRDLTKVRAIPNPLRYDRVELSSEPRERVLLVVSRLTESDKRLSWVLRLWRNLGSGEGAPGWRLVIVGDGQDRANYETMARELGLKNLTFTGAKEDPSPYYRTASVLLLTSAYEGWAMVLGEALQHGTPPVAVDSFPALRQIVEDGYNGLVVPDGDPDALEAATRRIMEDEALRRRLSDNGPESVRWMEEDRIIDRWEGLIDEVLGIAPGKADASGRGVTK